MNIAHRAILLAALLVTTLTFTAYASGDARIERSALLVPSGDAFVSSEAPRSNFGSDGQLLFSVDWVEQADVHLPDGTLYFPQLSQQIILTFDLGDIDFAIDKARLTLTPRQYNSAEPQTNPPLPAISASLDDWDEETVNWENRPMVHTVLLSSVSNQAGGMSWSDFGETETTLAEWLEYRRQSGAVATLMLEMPTKSHCWPHPIDAAVIAGVFADGSGAGSPRLELVSAETNLTPKNPTAITLIQSDAAHSDTRTLLLVALLVAFGTLYLGYMDE